MSSQVVIAGLTASYKLPGAFRETKYGQGKVSEGAVQCYAALAIPGIVLEAAPVAEASGAAAATLTVTFTGTWSAGGTPVLYLFGKAIAFNVTAGGTVTDAAAALVAEINGRSRFFCTAANLLGVVTITVRSKGVRGNDYIGRKDMTAAPTGLVMTITGGTALTGGLVPFTGGSGADDVTAVLSLLSTGTHDYQAWAQN